MDNVKKVTNIDMINKWRKRTDVLEAWVIVALICTTIVSVAIAAGLFNGYILKNEGAFLRILAGIAIGFLIIALACVLFAEKSGKRAEKETEALRRDCIRLKLVSQGHFNFLSLFTSPDEVTFLHDPKNDGEKFTVILIMKDGTIKSCDMRKEEADQMFEPMFK